MAKYILPAAIQAGFSHIQASLVALILCSTQPATYASAIAANCRMGSTAFVAANATVSAPAGGNDISFAAMPSIVVSADGNIDHVALVGTTALLFVTTATSKAVTIGDQVNVPAFKDTISNPT
jgi:hypothetical protein